MSRTMAGIPTRKLLLFDCDGTLVDSADIIHRCMELTFADFGKPAPALAVTKSIIGLTLHLAIARMLAVGVDAEIHAMTARYKLHFMAHRESGGTLEPAYDGMLAAVETLACRPDTVLGIVTGKSRRGLDAILAHHSLTGRFAPIRTSDDCPSKPHPAMVLECCGEAGIAPADTYVIGDAVFDMQMARSAGATAIGVSWGYGASAELRAAGAHHVVDHASALAGLI